MKFWSMREMTSFATCMCFVCCAALLLTFAGAGLIDIAGRAHSAQWPLEKGLIPLWWLPVGAVAFGVLGVIFCLFDEALCDAERQQFLEIVRGGHVLGSHYNNCSCKGCVWVRSWVLMLPDEWPSEERKNETLFLLRQLVQVFTSADKFWDTSVLQVMFCYARLEHPGAYEEIQRRARVLIR